MSRRNTSLVKAALTVLHALGADRAFRMTAAPHGLIYMLHHVEPEAPAEFAPNRILKITPDFLELVVKETRAAGFDILSLDEAAHRARGAAPQRPFACFTFDDGYVDNLNYAYPILKKHNVPFTIYITPSFADGHGDLWWLDLEQAIARATSVSITLPTGERRFETRTVAQKNACFHDVYWALRHMPERRARALVRTLSEQVGYNAGETTKRLPMTWDELRALNQDPLVTLGAHTVHHLALAKLSDREAYVEMEASVLRLEAELGEPCRHFSYPYGDDLSAGAREFRYARKLGMRTGVTTRKGVLKLGGPNPDLCALHRVSLNGDYQHRRYLRVLMSGLPFQLLHGAKSLTNRVSTVSQLLPTRLVLPPRR